ncbi:MAG: hypothetical protein IIA87_01310 [Nanoarchaeota archaeon]|nr:hypothetical protein [Nanoarchaeota archaeon]
MEKLKILSILGIILLTVFTIVISLNSASAYSHSFFDLSDKIVFKEDIMGEDRGFSLRRSTQVPRLTVHGYYDWSYRPDVLYPHSDRYRVSDRLALEAFKTFQQDSRDQNELERIKERNRFRYGSYFGYGYGSRGYGGYQSSYYPRYYSSFRYGF